MAEEMLYMRLSSPWHFLHLCGRRAAEWESSISHSREHTHTSQTQTHVHVRATRCLYTHPPPSCSLIYSLMRARALQKQKSALSFPPPALSFSTFEACRWQAANWFKSQRKQRAGHYSAANPSGCVYIIRSVQTFFGTQICIQKHKSRHVRAVRRCRERRIRDRDPRQK